MKISVPEYFTKFKCRADKCLDNCCVGWEIDIDQDTLQKYKNLDSLLETRFYLVIFPSLLTYL